MSATLAWKLNRLRAMSAAEVGWRVRRLLVMTASCDRTRILFEPPFSITAEETDFALDVLRQALEGELQQPRLIC